MDKIKVTLIVCLTALAFLISPLSTTWSTEENLSLKFQGRIFSAHIRGVPLRLVLEKLEREKGIRFKGPGSLLDERVTVQFTALPLEDGMKRILASMNCSFVFGRDGKLQGVVIIGRAASGIPSGRFGTVTNRRSSSSRPSEKHASTIEASDVVRACQPPGGPAVITQKELKSFRIMQNISPPGGSLEVTAREREKFKVMRNCPPQRSPIEFSGKELENFKVIENCPPPRN